MPNRLARATGAAASPLGKTHEISGQIPSHHELLIQRLMETDERSCPPFTCVPRKQSFAVVSANRFTSRRPDVADAQEQGIKRMASMRIYSTRPLMGNMAVQGTSRTAGQKNFSQRGKRIKPAPPKPRAKSAMANIFRFLPSSAKLRRSISWLGVSSDRRPHREHSHLSSSERLGTGGSILSSHESSAKVCRRFLEQASSRPKVALKAL